MKGRIIILIGLLLMLAGLIWYAATLRESSRAAWAAETVITQLQLTQSRESAAETPPDSASLQKERMTEKTVNGISYIGILEIPELSLKLPVISSWSPEYAKIAPCRYTGSVYQNDLILCAHNYDSHFGKLNRLKAGDAVEFADMDGDSFFYQVLESQIMDGTDVDGMRDGEWDMTLFTCTPGGEMRYCVRCKLVT